MKFTFILLFTTLIKLLQVKANDIFILTDSNFDEAIRLNKFVVVLFYAPWCGHCSSFEPVFFNTQLLIKAKGINNVLFAKLDATVNPLISQKQNIDKYPIVKIFGDGRFIEYDGIRSQLELYNWVLLQTNRGSVQLNSASEINELINSKEVFICFFGKSLSIEFLYYESASKKLAKEFDFYYCESEECQKDFIVGYNNLIIFKSFDEKRVDYQITSDVEKLVSFIVKYSTRVIESLTDTSVNLIFEKEYPALLFIKESSKDLHDLIKDVCLEIKVKNQSRLKNLKCIEFELNSPIENDFAKYLGLSNNEIPSIRLVDYNKQTGFLKKYKLENDLSAQNVKDFVDKWVNNQLNQYFF